MTPPPSPDELRSRFLSVKEVIEQWWPDYWTAHEACLSTASTLLLENVAQCVALILVGDSGSGKGSILYGYTFPPDTVFRSRFTAASILSTYGDANKQVLSDRALFRVTKHKLFVCSDLNPLLKAGDQEQLSRFYADFAVWLDGEGLIYDSGTHGALGERGDFTFAMIGGCTPLRVRVWRNMAELGPRLLFLRLDRRHKKGNFVRASEYDKARDACALAVSNFLMWLRETYPLRSQPWRSYSPVVEDRLNRLCQLAAAGQTFGGGLATGDAPIRPAHTHLLQRLSTIVHARCLLHGRKELDESDLSFAETITLSSTPGVRGEVLLALDRGVTEVPRIVLETGHTTSVIQSCLDDLQRSGVVTSVGVLSHDGPGRPATVWKIVEEEEYP